MVSRSHSFRSETENAGNWYCQTKETKCGKKGGRNSERLIVPAKQENQAEESCGGKGLLELLTEPLGGKTEETPSSITD